MDLAAARAIPRLTRAVGVNVLDGLSLPGAGAGVWEKAEYARMDKKDDRFYERPRFEGHMKVQTLAELSKYYEAFLGPRDVARHFDCCSSFDSHLPADYTPQEVVGLGMNGPELEKNPRLTQRVVQNLNKESTLPFPDNHFQAGTNVASIEYLAKPLKHLGEARRVLAPQAPYVVAFTTRAFWTKATHIWKELTHEQRMVLVASYFTASGFTHVEARHLIAPVDGDDSVEPLAVVHGFA
eukprot:TRINITY_DN32088_c0_g1_i1.p2 TRINITY_DN32088_c0_g1~~TRINITY_DN32088_c0_g1_i1.p2  ORF type:complete len:239 (+),score=88.56 TRINITY_DN32088_c0_g1_i1:72-788(+)